MTSTSTSAAAAEPRILKLQPTASGGEPLVYHWPLVKSKHYDAAAEIVETIEMVMEQYAELRLVMQRHCKLKDIDRNDYDQMKQLCDKFNKAAKTISGLWSGATRPGQSAVGADDETFLKKILQRCYNRAIEDPAKLNHHYEAWSSETYGETTFHRAQKILDELRIKPSDVFVDLGSGVGQVVVHAAGGSRCKKAVGIERADVPAKYAKTMKQEFERWMKWYGKKYQPLELYHDDFMKPEYRDLITNQATIIFINNYAFTADLNDRLKRELLMDLSDGTRIVTTRAFASIGERRLTDRHMSDLGAIMDVQLMKPVPNPTSWTCNNVDYYLHTVNRSKLEKYFIDKKHHSHSNSRSATASPDVDESHPRHQQAPIQRDIIRAQSNQSAHRARKAMAAYKRLKREDERHKRSNKSSSSRESSEKPSSSKGARASSKSRELKRKHSTTASPVSMSTSSVHHHHHSMPSSTAIPSNSNTTSPSGASGANSGGATVSGATHPAGAASDYAPYGPTTRRQWNNWVVQQERNKKDNKKPKSKQPRIERPPVASSPVKERSVSTEEEPEPVELKPSVTPPSVSVLPSEPVAERKHKSSDASSSVASTPTAIAPTIPAAPVTPLPIKEKGKPGRPRKSTTDSPGSMIKIRRSSFGKKAHREKKLKRLGSVSISGIGSDSASGTQAASSSSPGSVASAISPPAVSTTPAPAKHMSPRKQPVMSPEERAGLDTMHQMTLNLATAPVVSSPKDVHVSDLSRLPPDTFVAQFAGAGDRDASVPLNLTEDEMATYSRKHPVLNKFLASMRREFEKVLDQMMDKANFASKIREAIDAELSRKDQLTKRSDHLSRQVRQLQDDGVRLLKERLNELNIVAETPSDLMHQSKEIVMRHKELRSSYAMLECEVDLLQQENQKLVLKSRERDEQAIASGIIQQLVGSGQLSDAMNVDQAREFLVREIGHNLNRHQALMNEIVRMEQEVNALQNSLAPALNAQMMHSSQSGGGMSGTNGLVGALASEPEVSAAEFGATVARQRNRRPARAPGTWRKRGASITQTQQQAPIPMQPQPQQQQQQQQQQQSALSAHSLAAAAVNQAISSAVATSVQNVISSSGALSGLPPGMVAAAAANVHAGSGHTPEDIEKQIQTIVAKALSVDSIAKSAEKERKQKSAEKRHRRQQTTKEGMCSSSVDETIASVSQGHVSSDSSMAVPQSMTFTSAGLVPIYQDQKISDSDAKAEPIEQPVRVRQRSGDSAETESAPATPLNDEDTLTIDETAGADDTVESKTCVQAPIMPGPLTTTTSTAGSTPSTDASKTSRPASVPAFSVAALVTATAHSHTPPPSAAQ